ncbi:uncharacterized protein E0L32_012068 [Thyridium curvatum]|uniref:Mannose-6-phosphate isomerase n=1 Tax=Thyridium curvatum TaxID=1093900 RepID=A0A507BDR3_9PEZI|nr:uncharacterized protein E0L32_012068 [Thyridium curvatum]TPX17623.1 hypothetical protein E0L32_012068 [Thyridium curvatum]
MASLVFQLSGTCNNYPWGKKGRQSLAAQLCAQTPGTDFKIEDDQFYSEMWFGDYPNFPARILETGEPLRDVLDRNKEKLLGRKVIEKYDAQVPFLPKILSIQKALPLQIHPNKELASKLHKENPEKFTDPNHKPEIAVALSNFELFAGFKPLDEIAPVFTLLPELAQFVPSGQQSDPNSWTDDTLRQVTRAILKADEPAIKAAQDALLHRADRAALDARGGGAGYVLDLLPRLQSQHGARDPGTLVALLCMNFLALGPGEAVYVPQDGIHAYLSGDVVECMARSDNVLNTGFCPPAGRDSADLFAAALTFRAHARDDVYLPSTQSGKSSSGRTAVYEPDLSEFDMLRADLGAGEEDELSESDGPGVMIVTRGCGEMEADGGTFDLSEGFIFYVAPGVRVKWRTEAGMQIFMAVV